MYLGWADGENHASAFSELIEESWWDLRGSGRDDDAIEGRVIGTSCGAVTRDDSCVGVAKFAEKLASGGGELGNAFHRVHLVREFSEDGGLISGAGTDFEHPVFGGDVELFEHVADDVGLRDGLGIADGESFVVVSEAAELVGDEEMPGDLFHRGEDAVIVEAAAA